MKNNYKKDSYSFEKIKTVVIAVIVSIILWVAIVNVVNPDVTETFHNIPIQANGIAALREKGLVMVNAGELPSCSVKIRGKRKDIIESASKLYAVVNVSDINRQGEAAVSVIINSPSSVNLEGQSLTSVMVDIEPCYEKNIPIVIKQEEVPKGKLIKSESENDTLKISGSKKDLEKIEKCQITANLSDVLVDTNTMHSFVYLSDDNEQIEKPDTIYCAETNLLVYHTLYEKKTAKADLKISKEVSEEFRTDIDTQKILEKEIAYGIKLDSEQTVEKISYTLNAQAIKEGENKIKLKAEGIEGVYIPENQLVLSFNALKLETAEAEVSISTKNLVDGLLVTAVEKDGKYKLTGTKEELSDVKATVDLAGLSEGTHHLPLQFENKKLQPKEACFATVVITRKED